MFATAGRNTLPSLRFIVAICSIAHVVGKPIPKVTQSCSAPRLAFPYPVFICRPGPVKISDQVKRHATGFPLRNPGIKVALRIGPAE